MSRDEENRNPHTYHTLGKHCYCQHPQIQKLVSGTVLESYVEEPHHQTNRQQTYQDTTGIGPQAIPRTAKMSSDSLISRSSGVQTRDRSASNTSAASASTISRLCEVYHHLQPPQLHHNLSSRIKITSAACGREYQPSRLFSVRFSLRLADQRQRVLERLRRRLLTRRDNNPLQEKRANGLLLPLPVVSITVLVLL